MLALTPYAGKKAKCFLLSPDSDVTVEIPLVLMYPKPAGEQVFNGTWTD